MKPIFALAAMLLVLPAFGIEPATSQSTPYVGQRVFPLVMNGFGFNGFSFPDSPLLEAYVGESLLFVITVPATAETHVFHLHGHPWYDPSQSRFIDAKLLNPGDVHRFEVLAGGLGGNAGDWMYHCHLDAHFAHGMWGILRVYPYSMVASGSAPSFTMRLHRLGVPVHDATFDAVIDGVSVPVQAQDLGDGSYQVALPADAVGNLVLTAHAGLGDSVYRTTIMPGTAVVPSSAPVSAAVPALDSVRPAVDALPAVHALHG